MQGINNFDDLLGNLRESEPYIADDGFTSGIIARLPEVEQLPVWLSNLILLVFTATGSGIAAWQLPTDKMVSYTTSSLTSFPSFNLIPALGVGALVTFLLAYVVVWLAHNDSI